MLPLFSSSDHFDGSDYRRRAVLSWSFAVEVAERGRDKRRKRSGLAGWDEKVRIRRKEGRRKKGRRGRKRKVEGREKISLDRGARGTKDGGVAESRGYF